MITGDEMSVMRDLLRDALIVEVDGHHYVRDQKGGAQRLPHPYPSTLLLSTLTGLVNYARDGGEVPADTMAVVESPYRVALVAACDGTQRANKIWQYIDRRVFAVAEVKPPDDNDRVAMSRSIEDQIIYVMTRFEDTPERQALLSLLGNVTDVNSAAVTDDGVTQHITVSSGIIRKANAEASPMRSLRMIRSFADVSLPSAPYLLRIKKGADGQLRTSLTCCVGVAADADATQAVARRIQELWAIGGDAPCLQVIA